MKKLSIYICIFAIICLCLSGCSSTEFQEFIVFYDTGRIDRILATPDMVLRDGITARVKVVGRSENEYDFDYPYSMYYIQIIDDYHGGEKCDLSATYSILFAGTPKVEMYRQPALEIGKEYVVLNLMANNPVDRVFEPTYWFDIQIVDGKEYIYPYFIDCSNFESKIMINNDEENMIYKQGYHDDIINYLKKHNIDNPLFHYKFTIKDFLYEFRGLEIE